MNNEEVKVKKLKRAEIRIVNKFRIDEAYLECIKDLIKVDMVRQMKSYTHHKDFSCLDHCFHVSYLSYKVCKKLNLDCRAAARGGLLHDFFLYDWHMEKPLEGLHGFVHPQIALKNADHYFSLSEMERDIIAKHMWPITISMPRYTESFIVQLIDKYCATVEILSRGHIKEIQFFHEYTLLLSNDS